MHLFNVKCKYTTRSFFAAQKVASCKFFLQELFKNTGSDCDFSHSLTAPRYHSDDETKQTTMSFPQRGKYVAVSGENFVSYKKQQKVFLSRVVQYTYKYVEITKQNHKPTEEEGIIDACLNLVAL